MSQSTAGAAPVGTLALSVHGEAGVLDLLVPDGASASDVLREYAKQTGLPASRRLYDGRGRALPPTTALGDLGVRTGGLVVVADDAPGAPTAHRTETDRAERGPRGPVLTAAALVLAAVAGLLAALCVAVTGAADERLVGGVLLGCAVLGVLPLGGAARQRVLAAPAFGAAAALVVVADTASARLPMVLGVAALAAAVTAAVGRALTEEEDEGLRVWVVVGILVFVVAGVVAVLGWHERVAWATLLLLTVFAGRFVPGSAVDVPDQALIDIERLAVSAWSARDRAGGRRSRTVIRRSAVEAVVARGARVVTAACVAVLATTLVAAPLVLATTRLPLDRVGAPLLVALVGATHLLVARSYRHVAARLLLRAAGLWCLACVLVGTVADQGWSGRLGVAALVLGAAMVPVAVALGRGWRSVWWSRRAEVAEALTGAFAVPAFVVTVGLFRRIWEIVS
ncbi:hypothetical protein ACOACO_04660 [Nocardioides sp. CPCC 205120]|uniref:hypothetical protein n=1 Tax=Nocardioides sp. CPCC 205120 TaxID=3406462 RepID=UPI003B510C10